MTLSDQDLFDYAYDRLDTFDLTEWEVRINGRLTTTAGRCSVRDKTIEIARWTLDGDWDDIADTVNHEIAHALDWIKYGESGHGITWKLCCYDTGADPERTWGSKTSFAALAKPKAKASYKLMMICAYKFGDPCQFYRARKPSRKVLAFHRCVAHNESLVLVNT